MKDLEFHSSDPQPGLLQIMLNQAEKDIELTQLRARVKELEEKLAVSDLAVDLAEPFEMGLQARIRELEANEAAWITKEVKITEVNIQQAARIKELEEAMPDVSWIRDTIKHMRREGYGSIASPLESMAYRIEKATKK